MKLPKPNQIVIVIMKVIGDPYPAIAYHDGNGWLVWGEGSDEEVFNPGSNWLPANPGMILTWMEIPEVAGSLPVNGHLEISVKPPPFREGKPREFKGGLLRSRPNSWRG
jgi:hypothetical protein